MRSLERRFNNLQKYNPCWSSYICFAEAVKGQNFSARIIRFYFNELVEKDDYDKKEKKEIIRHLVWLSNEKKIAEQGMF